MSKIKRVDVLTHPEQRRRFSVEQKLAIVCETFEPGRSVATV
ncbi:transposase, partial [Staphylococcus aureus]|nr:transposase [Staphylococcus aureus]